MRVRFDLAYEGTARRTTVSVGVVIVRPECHLTGHEIEHAFDEQFAAAVKAQVEFFRVHRGVVGRVVAQPRQQRAERVVVAL